MRQIKKFNIDLKKIGMDKWLLIALAGVLIVMSSIPTSKKGVNTDKAGKNIKETQIQQKMDSMEYVDYMEKRLKSMIENIDGIGKAEVMITLKTTGEDVILMEKPYSKSQVTENDDTGGSRTTNELSEEQRVIYITESDGTTVPYVLKEKEPEIEGIAIVAKGGGNKAKAVQIISMTEALFSVSAHKISVVEMNE